MKLYLVRKYFCLSVFASFSLTLLFDDVVIDGSKEDSGDAQKADAENQAAAPAQPNPTATTTTITTTVNGNNGTAEVKYELGKRHFQHTAYGEFGTEGVDTIEKARKRLRAEAFGGEAQLERVLFEQKVTLRKDLPRLLAPNRMALLQGKNGTAATEVVTKPKALVVPNVTWNLLDGK